MGSQKKIKNEKNLVVAKNIHKVYKIGKISIQALSGVNLQIKRGEMVAVMGPSGCGKTTLLRIVAGLEEPTEGRVSIDGQVVSRASRRCGYVPQAYTLFPWLTVEGNIAFGLRIAHVPSERREETTTKLLELVGLREYRTFYPKALSGGMKQRVAIARALAVEPEVLLMDEPFGALDSQTRSLMQEKLAEIWEATKTTVLFVTHDIVEAVFLSDRVHVVSARPAVLRRSVDIPFERPRTHDLKRRREFVDLHMELMEYLRDASDSASDSTRQST